MTVRNAISKMLEVYLRYANGFISFFYSLSYFDDTKTVLRPTTFSGELTRVKQNLKYSRLTNCTEWFIIKKTDKRVERDK